MYTIPSELIRGGTDFTNDLDPRVSHTVIYSPLTPFPVSAFLSHLSIR